MLIFAPGADPSTPGVIYTGSGLRPTVRGYANYQAPVKYNGASSWSALTSGTTLGMVMYAHQQYLDGRIIVGGYTKLTELSVAFAKTDVSVGGGSYTTCAPGVARGPEDWPNYWCFASFGKYILAANKFNLTIQVQASKAAAFTSIANSPGCSTMCVFKNFVIVGNPTDYGSVTATQDMVAWSALGDHTSWAPSSATQAGFQQLFDIPGRIVCVKPLGDAVVIYKETGIWLMRATGNSASPWSFQLVVKGTGLNAYPARPIPIVDVGRAHIFIAQNGLLYSFDGASVQRIGVDVLGDSAFATRIASGIYEPSWIIHDAAAQEIYFFSSGYVFNYRLNKWGVRGAVAPTTPFQLVGTMQDTTLTLLGNSTDNYINDPGTFYIDAADLQVHGFYPHRWGSQSAGSYQDMQMSTLRGRNDVMSDMRIVAPRFVTPPNGSSTLDYYYRDDMGGTPVAVSTSIAMGAARHRFGVLGHYEWHDFRMTLNSTASTELVDVEYESADAGGFNVAPYHP